MSERQVTAIAAPPGTVHTPDGQPGTTVALPDDHLLVTLDDGRSFVVEARPARAATRRDVHRHDGPEPPLTPGYVKPLILTMLRPASETYNVGSVGSSTLLPSGADHPAET